MTKKLSRRKILRSMGYATCGGLVHATAPFGSGMRAIATAATAGGTFSSNPVLLLINFRGGFPLNIVPLKAGYWIDRFGDLAHADTSISLDGNTSLHPSLTGLKSIWDEGNLAIVHNCGYANPIRGVGVNRSHSDSTDIHFGGRPDGTPAEGWAVRFTNLIQSAYAGVSLGGSNFLVENGNNVRSFGSLDQLGESLFRRGGDWNTQRDFWKSARDAFLAAEAIDPLSSVPLIAAANTNIDRTIQVLEQQTNPDTNPLPDETLFPNSGFGRQMRDAARILNAPVLGSNFLYCEMGGYDTHSNERTNLTNRLNDWNSGVSAFYENVRRMGRLNDVVCVTMADFGRTSFRNGSGGTDHGHSCPWLIFGGRVQGGVKTPPPSLEYMTSGGSYIRTVDVEFPSLLATIVRCMGYDSNAVFPGYADSGLPLFL